MKRTPALAALSRDHHQALFVAQKLTRATPVTAAEARGTLLAYWEQHGRVHFRAEEEVLLPAYAKHGDPYDGLIADVLCDHVAIRQRVDALDLDSPPSVTALHELGGLLSRHVRVEERELFPLIEQALPPAELAAVAARLP